MKKFLLFLLIASFPCEVFADDEKDKESDLGAMRAIIEEAPPSEEPLFKPKISNRLVAETSFDNNYQSTNRQDEFKEIQGKIRFYSKLNFTKNFSLNSLLKVERQDNVAQRQGRLANTNGGGDRSFENNGIFVEELNLNYDNKDYGILAGKFNLNFGTAWRWDRGLWLRQIADNYREREKIGVGGVLHVGDEKTTGKYNFGFAAFMNDTKNLDNSILVNRDSSHKNDGVAGDDRGSHSYVASLDVNFNFGEKNGAEEKLSYHFSYINLAINERFLQVSATKMEDQKGYVAGMNHKYPLMPHWVLDSLIEFAEVKNFGGNSDISDRYLTLNFISKIYRNFLFNLGYAQRQNIHQTQNGFDQNVSEISVGYEFDKNDYFDRLVLQTGYKNQRTNDKVSSANTQNSYGFLVRYYKNF